MTRTVQGGGGADVVLRYVTLAEQPRLRPLLWELDDGVPEFLNHDPIADLHFGAMVDLYPSLQGLLLDGDEPVAKSHAVGLDWSGDPDDLPDRGWDAALERGVAAARAGRAATAVSAIMVAVAPQRRGSGLSRRMLEGMRDAARGLGVGDLFAPVRPTAKADEPHEPMGRYAYRTRDDGELFDPWLRTHARLGATVVTVCPTSMTIPGTLGQWRRWTGLAFDTSGAVVVPGALVPVHVDVDQDHAVYVEPNVWMHHRL